jgi:hypothetical protein
LKVGKVAEVRVATKCIAVYLSFNATESSENFIGHCLEIKTLLLKVLTELIVMKGSVELLQTEIRGSKVGVIGNTVQ